MAKVTVRLTLFQEPVEIDEDEVPSLRAQGLLIEDDGPPASPGPPAPSPADGGGRAAKPADKTEEPTP